MLIMAHERESIYNDIQTSTKAVVFFGTPHGGSDLASLSRVLRNIFDVCTLGSVRADLLKNLERRSAELAEIAEQFVERASQLKIVTVTKDAL
jgi:cell division FtsZ-interacting protein ZapD